jgi:DNA/RNA-binding domain of Phe-tRNA-synthetase-like protein
MNITNHLIAQLIVGINIYEGIEIIDRNQLQEFIHQQSLDISASHLKAMPPGFALSRKLYRSFHIDPTKHRPSSEALWRRLKKKGDFPRVNPLVDLTNLLSVRYQICYGLYDLDKLNGPVDIALGQENEQYPGIRKDIIHLHGRIMLRDLDGPFGNPSSDSLRSATSDDSQNILQVLFFHPEDPDTKRITAETKEVFCDHFSMRHCQSFMA